MKWMKTRPDVTPSAEEMRELIAALSAEERASLKDPNFITEDEADIIMSDRAMKEPGRRISLDDLLKENGQGRRKRIA